MASFTGTTQPAIIAMAKRFTTQPATLGCLSSRGRGAGFLWLDTEGGHAPPTGQLKAKIMNIAEDLMISPAGRMIGSAKCAGARSGR